MEGDRQAEQDPWVCKLKNIGEFRGFPIERVNGRRVHLSSPLRSEIYRGKCPPSPEFSSVWDGKCERYKHKRIWLSQGRNKKILSFFS